MQVVEDSFWTCKEVEGIGNKIGLGIEAGLNLKNPFNLCDYQFKQQLKNMKPSPSFIPNNEPNFLSLVLIIFVSLLGLKILLK